MLKLLESILTQNKKKTIINIAHFKRSIVIVMI